MTDLINKIQKIGVDEIEKLKFKYEFLKEIFNDINIIPYLLVVIDIAVNHVKKNHDELTSDWKAWSIVVIKSLYINGKIKKEKDIPIIIDDFIEYQKQEYQNYCDDIIAATEFDKDYGFVLKYIKTKNR